MCKKTFKYCVQSWVHEFFPTAAPKQSKHNILSDLELAHGSQIGSTGFHFRKWLPSPIRTPPKTKKTCQCQLMTGAPWFPTVGVGCWCIGISGSHRTLWCFGRLATPAAYAETCPYHTPSHLCQAYLIKRKQIDISMSSDLNRTPLTSPKGPPTFSLRGPIGVHLKTGLGSGAPQTY